MSESRELSELREKIRDVDRGLVELLSRRMELSAAVGRLQARTDDPHLLWDVDSRAPARAREQAEACGVSEEVMEEIFRSILRGSIQRQHRVGLELREASGHTVLVIGGAGGMGSWFRRFLERTGHDVHLLDPVLGDLDDHDGHFARLEDVTDLNGYEAIVIAVPLDRTPTVMQQVIDRRPRGLIVELSSIKTPHVELARRAHESGLQVACIHPMFGPGKSPYEPLNFVHGALGDDADERRRIEALLEHPYTHLVTLPLDHHDRLMGWLLGLAHLSGMVFASALSRSGLDPEELRACASTTFQRQSATATSILAEDPGLYLDIQRLNPHRVEVYEAAGEALAELVGLVEDGEPEAFRAALERARRAVVPD